MSRVLLMFLLLLSASCFAAEQGLAKGVQVAQVEKTLPEPSDEETEILIYVNKMRMFPRIETLAIMGGAEGGIPGMHPRLDYAKCTRELRALEPAPPLVFDQHLIRSARAHAQYMITHNITSHDEDPEKEGFTGRTPIERIQIAGYRGYAMGENAFQYAVSPWHSHVGFMIDWGPEPDGMQTGRGHRKSCMSPMNREIGIGAVRFNNGMYLSTCHNFGFSKTVPRFLGGVIYKDLNNNGVYDPGEGQGGVLLKTNSGESVETWDSGAFTLALQHRERFEVKLYASGSASAQELGLWRFPAGKENVWLYTQLPNQEDKIAVEKLIKRAKTSAGEKLHPLDLWWLAKDFYQSQDQTDIITTISADFVKDYREAQAKCLEAFGTGDKKTLNQTLSALKKEYGMNKAWAWFSAADKSMDAFSATKKLIDTIRSGRPIRSTAVSKHIRLNKRVQSRLENPFFERILQSQIDVLTKTLGKRR